MRRRIAALCAVVTTLSMPVHAAPVGLHCWIVADDAGQSSHSFATISNNVAELNRIFSQVAMSFEIQSISCTNSSHLSNVVFTNDLHISELCSITNGTGGLEVYFVETITDGTDAFCATSGVVVSRSYNRTTLAHEVGHACGLKDVYVGHRETSLTVTGMPCKVWSPLDWGWYPDFVTQEVLIKRLLMYGVDTADKGDISRGDIYALWYSWILNEAGTDYVKDWHLSLAPVGFKAHGNRHPRSQ